MLLGRATIMELVKSESGRKIRKACAACKHQRKRCPPECVFAPYFSSESGTEDFKNVARVFGASNFSKLLMRVKPEQRFTAADSMIMEARFRMDDPVHGLSGIIETLQKKLANSTSELAIVNQQNQFHRQRSVVEQQELHQLRQFQSNEAKGASSSAPRAVPSLSLQQINSGLAHIDEVSSYFPNVQVDPYRYNAVKPFASLVSANNNMGDTAVAKVVKLEDKSHQCSCGVVFKWSNDAADWTRTSVKENRDVVQNFKDPVESIVNLSQENERNVKCSMDVEEPTWDFTQENKADYNECPTNLSYEGEDSNA